MRPPLALTEIGEGRGAAAEIRRREADAFRAALPANTLLVALDQDGAALASETLAASLGRWMATGRPLAFAIGGAEGLEASLRASADSCLSLGPQTWPHMLARIMLAEQLYRAQSILAGHPYHRAARP